MSSSKFFKYFPIVFATVLIGGGVATYFLYDPFQGFIDETWTVLLSDDEQRIASYFSDFGFWGPVAIIVFSVFQIFLIIFPSWLPMVIAALAYGFWYGILISLTGLILSASLGFIIGKLLGKSAKGSLVSEKNLEKAESWGKEYGFWTVVLFRISPILSNDGISIIAGIVKMGYWRYLTATLVGLVPLNIAVAIFSEDTSTLKQGMYWIGGAGLVLYALYIYIDQRKKKANNK